MSSSLTGAHYRDPGGVGLRDGFECVDCRIETGDSFGIGHVVTDIAAVDCPVLGMFGETDHLISINDVRRFRDCLERHGKSFRIHVYRDAPHGWLNDTMPGRYRRAQAEAAWATQREFLQMAFATDYDRSTCRHRYEAGIATDYNFSRNVRQE